MIHDSVFSVDGNWGAWTSGPCFVTCGSDGTKMRTRLCNNPPEAHGGKPCTGDPSEIVSCTGLSQCPGNMSSCLLNLSLPVSYGIYHMA